MYHRQEFLPGHGILPEASKHAAGHKIRTLLVDATRRHAMMNRLDHYADTPGLENFLDRVGDLRGQPFLDLKPSGIGFDHARAWKYRRPVDPANRRPRPGQR